MRWYPVLLLLLCHCSTLPSPSTSGGTGPVAPAAALPALPSHPAQTPHFAQQRLADLTLSGLEFDDRSHRLMVVDQAAGPGSLYRNAAHVAQTHAGLAAINGGFFTPQGEPLGLVIANGHKSGTWNGGSSLGSGLFCETAQGPMLVRSSRIGAGAAVNCQQALQAGPWLVEAGQSVSGLDGQKQRERTIILWDGGHRWWIGCSSPCSLKELGQVLTRQSPTDWPVHHALNLDGGSSCDLWVDGSLTGGNDFQLHVWARPVRNHLVLLARTNALPGEARR
ncbi:MAG TPA: phosphodiester glycosidase family protein [Luteolibacter sp.]|nr:phosphodiester glycosidase family protein [Luteolibacter sp.]